MMSKAAVLATMVASKQVLGATSSGPLKLQMLNDTTANEFGAKCLDGSNYGFYFEASKSDDAKNKWVFMLEGGGVCYTPQDCQWRKDTTYGSSKQFAQTTDEQTVLSPDAANPFRDWNKVFLAYCSGDSWTGTLRNGGKHGLQFAGKSNIAATIAVLKGGEFGLANAEEVLLSGTSAGGIGVNNNCDWFASQLGSASTMCNPQAGLFFPKGLEMELQSMLSGEILQGIPPDALSSLGISGINLPANAIASILVVSLFESADNLDESCIKDPPYNLKHLCWAAGNALEHISTPTFVVQNFWDSYQLHTLCHKGADECTDPYLKTYKELAVSTVSTLVEKRRDWGGWMPSCNKHNSNFRMEPNRGPEVQGKRMAAALGSWMQVLKDDNGTTSANDTLPARLFIDDCKGDKSESRPCNAHCSAEEIPDLTADGSSAGIRLSPRSLLYLAPW